MPPVHDCGDKQTSHASLVIRETKIKMSTRKNVDPLGQFSHLKDGTIANMLIHYDNLSTPKGTTQTSTFKITFSLRWFS